MGSQPGICTAWRRARVLSKIQSCESHATSPSCLDPHSGRPRGGGKVFLPREKEKLDSGGRCWLEGGLAIDRLTFHSSPGCSADSPTPGHQSELHILPLAIVSYPGPLGAGRLPAGTIFNSGGRSLSHTCTFFWSVLSGYEHIQTAAVDMCCLIPGC